MTVAAPTVTGSTGTSSLRDGWHLVKYVNGDVALVLAKNGEYQWGSTGAPNSQVITSTFLGAGKEAVAANDATWERALMGLPLHVVNALVAIISENGKSWSQGDATVLDKAGTAINGSDSTLGGSATPAGVNPPSLPGISNPLSFFTSSNFWKGIGLSIAGGLILIFAALEFLKMSGTSLPKAIPV